MADDRNWDDHVVVALGDLANFTKWLILRCSARCWRNACSRWWNAGGNLRYLGRCGRWSI